MKRVIQKNFAPVTFILITTLTLIYIIGFLQITPYAGFRFGANDFEVIQVFDETQQGVLEVGDRIIRIGDLTPEEYENDLSASFWTNVAPGEIVPIEIKRDGEILTVPWRFTGYNKTEFNDRFFSQWPLSIFFLFFGVITFNSVRPKNILWALLMVFNFTAAILIAAGSGASHSHLLYAAYVLHLAAWVLVPVIIHIHWLFPIPFKGNLNWVNKYIITAIYLITIPLMMLDLSNPSEDLYFSALLFSFLTSLGLMIFRIIRQKQSRKQLRILFRFTFTAFFPMIVFTLLQIIDFPINDRYSNGAILSFPLISAGYLFAIWQGQTAPVQFRANRVLSLTIYTIVLMPITVIITSLLSTDQNEISTTLASILIISSGVIGVILFNPFQRFVERVLLGIPVPIPDLLKSYSKNLTDAETPAVISSSMGSLVLPTLLVRQSVVLEMQTQSLMGVLDYYGVEESQIPQADTIRTLVEKGPRILTPEATQQLPPEYQWIRVVMPLNFDHQLIGVWLLGARDPDDIYPPQILSTLESIAQQTTFVIINHQKTTRLRALYQSNIHRNEAERASLSRDLHDETLNQIALLQREHKDPQLKESLEQITTSLREMIQGLRPDLVSFGLATALEDLAYSLNERYSTTLVETNLQGPSVPISGMQDTELQIFRIVQQACENALRHAEAQKITIEGVISQEFIEIVIRDDGKGFEGFGIMDLTNLIKKQKYGLPGMHERADLINADLKIQSQISKGTQVIIAWPTSRHRNLA